MITFTRPIYRIDGKTGEGELMKRPSTGQLEFRQYFETNGFESVEFEDVFCKEFEAFCRENNLFYYDGQLLKIAGQNMMSYYCDIQGDV